MSLLPAEEFYRRSQNELLIDVRSPKEFEAGHIVGAANIPLFDDQQREIIGCTYKQVGRNEAVLQGLEFVGPKMADFVRQTRHLLQGRSSKSGKVFVHCWRGGMRSKSFAWLLETSGLTVQVLEGGYKAYRKLAHRTIGRKHAMIVLSGLTGAGKTEFLKLLKTAGEQVIDLEALANHRGSSFGAIGLGKQPSTEQFENRLFQALDGIDRTKRFWVEDEGSRLGHVVVPSRFVKQVRRAPAVFLDVPMRKRLDNLLDEYGDLDQAALIEATRGIQKRLGGQNMINAISAIERGDLREAAEISLSYYDRSYLKAKAGMPRKESLTMSTNNMDANAIVEAIIGNAKKLMANSPFPIVINRSS